MVETKRTKKIVFFFPAFSSQEATAPLGILAVSTPLLRAGYQVKIVDSTITPNFQKQVAYGVSSAVSYVSGSHSLKVGLQWRFGPVESQLESTNGDLNARYRSGVADSVTVRNASVFAKQYLNADLGLNNSSNEGVSWIDLFSRGPIVINGDDALPFSVHANGLGGSGADGEEGGIVTVKSKAGSVTASGKALQATSTKASNSDAGRVTVEAESPWASGPRRAFRASVKSPVLTPLR